MVEFQESNGPCLLQVFHEASMTIEAIEKMQEDFNEAWNCNTIYKLRPRPPYIILKSSNQPHNKSIENIWTWWKATADRGKKQYGGLTIKIAAGKISELRP